MDPDRPDSARRRRRPPAAPALLAVALLLLSLSWAMSNPPFAAPDEAAHFLRAVGISDGHWVGTRATDPNPVLTPKQRRWTNQATRAVVVPAGLSPGGITPCMSGHPAQSAACTTRTARNAAAIREVSTVGTYQPAPYLLPAAALRLAHHASSADRLARLATLVVWWALLAAAAWLLWDAAAGAASLAGPALAITPQVVFVGASLTGSSLEVAASCALFAALLRLARAPGEGGRAAWVVAGIAGVLLALSRSPGPVWVLIDVAVWTLIAGRATLRRLWTAQRAWLLGAFGAMVAAIALNRLWEGRYGPTVQTSLLPPLESLKAGRREFTGVLDELVGHFGYLDTPLAKVWVALWGLLTAGLAVAALRAGSRRERRALVVVAAVVALAPMYLFAAVTRFTGFGLQGRHVLAVVVLLPLFAGELLRRHRVRVPAAVLAVVGAVQLVAWWTNARRYAVGDHGSWWFLGHAQWSPPAGWWPWLLVALGGALGVAASGVVARRQRRPA